MAIRFPSPQLPQPRPTKAFKGLAGADLVEARRKAIAESNRIITVEEWNALSEALFPFCGLLRRELDFACFDPQDDAPLYHAVTHDNVHVIYSQTRNVGLWLLPGTGMGPLKPQDLRVLKQIVDPTH